MTRWRTIAAAGLSLALLAVAAPAQAQHVTVVDAAGDASGDPSQPPGLDITSVNFANHDHAIITTLTFTRDRTGTIIVAVKARDHGVVAVVVSKHRRQGPDRTFEFGHAACNGLSSDWNRTAATLRLRLPARCVLNGNYGAIKSWALIEGLHDGADVDYAPESRDGSNIAYTDWIPRG